MVTLGLILMLIGLLSGVAIFYTVGILLLVVGVVLWILGSTGHAVGGRRHYY
jgi:hypothetical protein